MSEEQGRKKKSLEERRRQLLEMRRAILRKLYEIEDQLDDPLPKDDEEAAIELEDDEVLEKLGELELKEQRAIEAALKRIEEGEYGYCVVCGREIPEERLDLIPYTPFCAEHAPK